MPVGAAGGEPLLPGQRSPPRQVRGRCTCYWRMGWLEEVVGGGRYAGTPAEGRGLGTRAGERETASCRQAVFALRAVRTALQR